MLIQANCIKHALNTAGLTLQAGIGQSFMVKAIYVGKCDTDAYALIKIDNFTVGCWLVKGKRGNQLGGVRYLYYGYNLMVKCIKHGLAFKYPIAEGQKLTIPALDGLGTIQVVYDIYTAGDITATMPNGTQSKNFSFIQYMRESAVLTASGDMLLDESLTPSEFPDFPAGKVVPPRMKIKLHGVHGTPNADFASAGNGFYTTYLKFIREREVLFDEDRQGLHFLGNSGATGPSNYNNVETLIGCGGEITAYSTAYKWNDPLWFEPALVFQSGEELNVYLSWVLVGAHTMPANLPNVDLILEVNKD